MSKIDLRNLILKILNTDCGIFPVLQLGKHIPAHSKDLINEVVKELETDGCLNIYPISCLALDEVSDTVFVYTDYNMIMSHKGAQEYLDLLIKENKGINNV